MGGSAVTLVAAVDGLMSIDAGDGSSGDPDIALSFLSGVFGNGCGVPTEGSEAGAGTTAGGGTTDSTFAAAGFASSRGGCPGAGMTGSPSRGTTALTAGVPGSFPGV